MHAPRIKFLGAVIPTIVLIAAASVSPASAGDTHCIHPEPRSATGALAPPLAQMRVSCPVLAAIVEESVLQDLGEAFPIEDARPQRVDTVIAQDAGSFARLALDARTAGATMDDFRETLYLTAVTAGVPEAIEATRVLLRIFSESSALCANTSGDTRPSF